MADLAQEFHQAMLEIYTRANAEINYNPSLFLQMVLSDDGVVAATQLINSSKPSPGYTRLYEEKRLDLSAEALVVDNPRWHSLFPPEVIERARKRLQDYHYKFPETLLPPDAAGSPTREGAWTRSEVEACVSAYLEMLALEVEGRPYVKALFNRRVQEVTGRSKGSVEFKFENVSAILDRLGLRWVEGYKPAKNAQAGAITDALDRLLGANAVLASRLEVPVLSDPIVPAGAFASVFVDAPPKSAGERSKNAAQSSSKIGKFDRALRDAKNRQLGRAGEEFVLKVERDRLRSEGRADLAAKVKWISEEQGDGAGYDISSFAADESPMLIEVKTTNGEAATSFLVSANEVKVSRAKPEHYWLYRVFEFAKEPRVYREQGALDYGWNLEPAVFRARR